MIAIKILYVLIAIVTILICWQFATKANVTHINDVETTGEQQIAYEHLVIKMRTIFFFVAVAFAIGIGLCF